MSKWLKTTSVYNRRQIVLLVYFPTKLDYSLGSNNGPFLDIYYFLFILMMYSMSQISFPCACRGHNLPFKLQFTFYVGLMATLATD